MDFSSWKVRLRASEPCKDMAVACPASVDWGADAVGAWLLWILRPPVVLLLAAELKELELVEAREACEEAIAKAGRDLIDDRQDHRRSAAAYRRKRGLNHLSLCRRTTDLISQEFGQQSASKWYVTFSGDRQKFQTHTYVIFPRLGLSRL